MIISDAPGHIIAKLRHLAGPAPAGCRLTHTERLHLIYLLIAMIVAGERSPEHGYAAREQVRRQLTARGMAMEDVVAVFADNMDKDAHQLADVIALHSSLESADYLD